MTFGRLADAFARARLTASRPDGSPALGVTSMTSLHLPLWLRVVLLVAAVILAAAAGLFGYRYYNRPTTLSVAVGSIDGEAAKAMTAIANRLASTNAPVRLRV